MQELKSRRGNAILRFIGEKRALALMILIVVICLIFSILYPNSFGTFDNMAAILLNMAAEGLIVVAIVPLLICGDIDLSLGSTMVLSATLCGKLMISNHLPMVLAIVISLSVALVCGLINGFIVARINVVPFITTLATSMIYLGIAIMLAGTGWTDFGDKMFTAMGQSKFLGLQLPVYYVVAAFIISSLLIAKTRFFRQAYYIGGNAKAAEWSGIRIIKTKMVFFMLASLLAGCAGLLSAMRFNSALTSVGTGVEMRAVTAAVIGGVSFTGGAGSMAGAALGALFVACLNNILTVAGVNQNVQYVATGVILILSIVLDVALSKDKK